MGNPLNDFKSFAAVCAGTGFAFGVAALFTLGRASDLTYDFVKMALVSVVVSVVASVAVRVCATVKTDETVLDDAGSSDESYKK